MKKIITALLVAGLLSTPFLASAATKVKGHTKKNGTYVQPYYKSSPNKTKIDNYSAKGNYNPYSGKKGTVNPYKW